MDQFLQRIRENYIYYAGVSVLIPAEVVDQTRDQYIKDVTQKPPEKNPLAAVTYNSKFLETDGNTARCTYDTHLECDNDSFNKQIEFYMKLDEVKKSKTIYFHDSRCHNKAIVDNHNGSMGEACVNLSYMHKS